MYKQRQTNEARNDLKNLTAYMIYTLRNIQAAINSIRMKPFSTYNIFYVVDETTHQITILRILKNRQDWKYIMYSADNFSF